MFRSLSVKVALPLALAVTAVSMAITQAGEDLRREALTRLTAERAHSLLALTLKTINAVTPEGHRPDLQPFLDELVKAPDVMSVRILDTRGVVKRSVSRADIGRVEELLTESPRDAAGSPEPRVFQVGRDTVLRTFETIPNPARCRSCHGSEPSLGRISLALAVSHESEDLLWWRVGLATNFLQALTLVILTAFIVTALVSRPVRHLALAMDQIQHGNLDVQVQPVGTKEIDTVVVGFNEMVRRLRDARKAEDETQRLERERAEHLAAVAELAAGLAHEIRNPVAGVKAAVEVLAGRMPHDDMRRQILRESVSELDRVDKVIKDLLNYARPRPLQLAAVDLNDVARGACHLTAARASAEGVDGTCELADEPLTVHADAGLIRQVIDNLLLNAIQATAGCSPRTVVLTTAAESGEAVVGVRDSGPGVEASQAEGVFKPFFTTKSRGTGLGLAISRRIIEMHGGRIWVENPGQPHAEFRFALPLPAAAASGREPASGDGSEPGGPR
jgi:two-component system, NtrC family, sensor kinase